MPLLIYDGVLIACVPFCRLRAPDARRHGRYETEGLHAAMFFVLVVDNGSGMHWLVFTGDAAPRAVFFFVRGRPMMLGIKAGMNQKNSYAHGWFCVATLHLALYFSSFAAGP